VHFQAVFSVFSPFAFFSVNSQSEIHNGLASGI